MDNVTVVGMGYVGLTLAVTLAGNGVTVVGVERDPAVRGALREGRAPFFEPGLDEALATLPPGRFSVRSSCPQDLGDAVVICVGTPVAPTDKHAMLGDLTSAAADVARQLTPGTLVVLRSTVPVGTTRGTVLPLLAEHVPDPLLAYCPDRTIQGIALREITQLPQVVGALDEHSARRAADLAGALGASTVPVSSLEAAELVKLVCNSHTDVLYGFGNQVAVVAETLALDATEVIGAANLGYPRPDLARPGYVGGSCLTKDPYLLVESVAPHGYLPPLVTAARTLNEQLPVRVTERLLAELARRRGSASDCTVLVCGLAYKGSPPTADTRGSAAQVVIPLLRDAVASVLAHDPVLGGKPVAALDVDMTELDEGLRAADAVMFLTDHPHYRALDIAVKAALLRPPAVVSDMWGMFAEQCSGAMPFSYLRVGRG
jgi:UDP-N-acetyl-D-mannosaminuronic acid dehydrogenase